MINAQKTVEAMSSADLLTATQELVRSSRGKEAELLVHLGEIDERKLYLQRSYRSRFAFCLGEYNFSEDAAAYRITVARAARRLPLILEAVRKGEVHLAGLRVLVPHLTTDNQREVLAAAAGKSRSEIEELVARLAPKPPVPTLIRKVSVEPPSQRDARLGNLFANSTAASPTQTSSEAVPLQSILEPAPRPALPVRREQRAEIKPLAEETYKFQFTATRACRDKLRQARELLRRRVPDGDVGAIVEMALDALIETVMKERFAQVSRPRKTLTEEAAVAGSRHIPSAIKRAVFERDRGQCTFTDDCGRRCEETVALEFDHLDGFARTRRHELDRIRLLCDAHNQYAAEQMYGREFMQRARESRDPCPSPPLNPSG